MKSEPAHSTGVVYFSHGKESGPWGDKIKRLAQVAEAKGFVVYSIRRYPK